MGNLHPAAPPQHTIAGRCLTEQHSSPDIPRAGPFCSPPGTPGLGPGPGGCPEETEVTAIVVSYQSRDELPACLEALERQSGARVRIVVVDNASPDDSARLVRDNFPAVRVIESPVNLGFGRAINRAVESAASPFLALVNPDAILPPDALCTCIAHLLEHPRAGVVGTRLVGPDGSTQASMHSFPTVWNVLGEALRLDRILPGWKTISRYRFPASEHDRVRSVDWIQGSFLVVRREVLATVGGFDPEFFMYGEELEWCFRVRQHGFEIVFLPGPPVLHVGGASARRFPEAMFIEHVKGRIRFFRKHRGAAALFLVRALLAASIAGRWAWREIQVLGLRLLGPGAIPGELLERRSVFRAALAWVLRGQPLASPSHD